MTNGDLNQFILHYLTKDKTHSAIMLTGSWGTGKSYYIQNVLVPFLKLLRISNQRREQRQPEL